MLLRAPLPLTAMQWLLRLVLWHDCEAQFIAPGLLYVEGERVLSLLTDALLDTRISVVQTTVEA